jgi:hypothetical protein
LRGENDPVECVVRERIESGAGVICRHGQAVDDGVRGECVQTIAVLSEMSTLGVEVSNSGEAIRFGVTAMTDELLVSSGDQCVDDGTPNETGSAEDDHSHGRT